MKLHGHNIKSNVQSSIIRFIPSNRQGNKSSSNSNPNQDQKASNRPSKCDFREIITLTCVKSVANDFCFSFDRFGVVTSCSTHKRAYSQPLNSTRLLLHSNLHFCTSISRERVSDKSRADINMQERGDKLLIGAYYSLGSLGRTKQHQQQLHGPVKLSSIKRIRAKRVGVIVKAAISSREAKNFRKVISIKARKHFLPRPSGAIVTRSTVATHDDLCAI